MNKQGVTFNEILKIIFDESGNEKEAFMIANQFALDMRVGNICMDVEDKLDGKQIEIPLLVYSPPGMENAFAELVEFIMTLQKKYPGKRIPQYFIHAIGSGVHKNVENIIEKYPTLKTFLENR